MMRVFNMSGQAGSGESTFFEQWNSYRKVIKYNYMSHAQIIDVIRQELYDLEDISILDLGCGDSHVLACSVDKEKNFRYLGIDTANDAIRFSEQNLTSHKGIARHIHGDFFAEMGRLSGDFDVIISGYSLHHLKRENKEEFFALVSNLLSARGTFMFYDAEVNSGESQSDCKTRTYRTIREHFRQLDANEMNALINHVRDYDLPEDEDFHVENMRKNGFIDIKKPFKDKYDLYSLYVSKKPA
ncbi:MAG: class I SAM-dependent methyltransferase [Candidatus Thiosymbion ectosymbiont of Robbea hypermnestra]|nr:class I SAM-dependent methyltransferase [Candidatus Thiosymbion ectosymbiont of Robbea hypermnestra]